MVRSEFFIFDKVIRITVKVSSVKIALSIGCLNDKNCLSEGHPIFLSIFPIVNLRIFKNPSFSVYAQYNYALNK